MSVLFNRVWKTPGGVAYNIYLQMLSEENLMVVGDNNHHRCVLRNALFYTLLFQSPLKANFVLLGESFEPFSKLPHSKGFYTNHRDIYGVLVKLSEMMSEKVNQHAPTLYVFLEDYSELLAHNELVAFPLSCLAKSGKLANIKLVVFTEQFKSSATLLSPNVELVAENMIYKGACYNIPTISHEECSNRVKWWTSQHKHGLLDKITDIMPSRTQTVDTMNGLQYEAYVAQKLRKMGYKNLKITKASGDYGADIIATDSNGKKTCIQCKKYHGSVGVHAVQEIIAAKGYYSCKRAIVITTATFTANAKTLAKSQNVELIEHFI